MLHIWLPSQQSQLFVWKDTQHSWQSYDNWQSLAHDTTEKSVCLYFPSSHILQLDKDLSLKQIKQLGETGQQYLFEEMSLGSVEKLSIKHESHAGHQRLFGCSKVDIEQWQNAAFIAGMKVKALLPDFLLLPFTEDSNDTHYLYHDAQTTLTRSVKITGSAIGYLPMFIEGLAPMSELVIIPSITSGNDSSSIDDVDLEEMQKINDSIVIQKGHATQHLIKPVELPLRHALNFAINAQKRQGSSYLNVTIGVALLALIVQICVDGVSAGQFKKAHASVQTNIEQQFTSWFPEQRLNSRVGVQPQLQPYLASTSDDASLMSSFNRVSLILQQSNLVAKELLIDSNAINITLYARNRNELNDLIESIAQQGITAELGAINNLTAGSSSAPENYTLLANITVLSESKNNEENSP